MSVGGELLGMIESEKQMLDLLLSELDKIKAGDQCH